MDKRYFGPFTLLIDDDNQVVTVELKRCGPKSGQLQDGEIRLLREYVLAVARSYGFAVVEV